MPLVELLLGLDGMSHHFLNSDFLHPVDFLNLVEVDVMLLLVLYGTLFASSGVIRISSTCKLWRYSGLERYCIIATTDTITRNN